jgi:hypothetical protein
MQQAMPEERQSVIQMLLSTAPFGVVTNGCTACPKSAHFAQVITQFNHALQDIYGDRTGLSVSQPVVVHAHRDISALMVHAVPTANPCGSAAYYCPQGSSAPVACIISSISGMSTPYTASPAITRTGCLTCPQNRLCNAGQLVPGADFGNYCPSGAITMYMNVTGVMGVMDVGMPLIAATPGWVAGSIVNYNISAVSPVDPACSLSEMYFRIMPTLTCSHCSKLELTFQIALMDTQLLLQQNVLMTHFLSLGKR